MNFKTLIDAHQIIIPLIQRDYAQGREEEEKKARKFLKAILDGMDSENGLNLDFIYGNFFDGNKFTPLDGQQRLTTLYLLYFYLSLKEDREMASLKNFSYEVRASSADFIEELVKNRESLQAKGIRKSIENANWFFLSWNNDPTIIAILNMFDLIEEMFSQANFSDLEKITFDRLRLNKFDLTDALYVKMNSRGKPLSDFENFKSEFEKFVEKRFEHEKAKEYAFKSHLDNEWLDIFWEMSDYNPLRTDRIYFNFFTNLTLFFDINNITTLDAFDVTQYQYTREDIDAIETLLFVLTSYHDTQLYAIRNINVFQNFLKPSIKEDKQSITYENRAIIKEDKQSITYENRAIFYALMQFFLQKGSVTEENRSIFISWMRVAFNLVNNMVFDNIGHLKNAMGLIDKLSENIEDIYAQIQNPDIKNTSDQFKEECLKAKLITEDKSWEKELLLAEKHWYLDGQIQFLLDFAENDRKKFILYRDKFIALFDRERLFSDTQENSYQQTLIHRALLACEEDSKDLGYLKYTRRKNSDKYTFCSYNGALRVKNENWRRVFGSSYFKELLDFIDSPNIEKSLEEKIDAYTFDCKNFKSYLINPNKKWEVISSIRNYQIEYKNAQKIFLNRGRTSVDKWGWYRVAELQSFYLYKEFFEDREYLPFQEIWYWVTSDGNPSIVLDKYKEKYAMDIYYDNGFYLMFYNYKTDSIRSQQIKYILEEYDFISDGQRYYLKTGISCDRKRIKKIVEDICLELS